MAVLFFLRNPVVLHVIYVVDVTSNVFIRKILSLMRILLRVKLNVKNHETKEIFMLPNCMILLSI